MGHPRYRCRRCRPLLEVLGATALAAILAVHARGAAAMVFSSGPEDQVLRARGEIVFGDAARFAQAVRFLPPGRRPITLRVESRGGHLGEAAKMAAMVRRAGMTVVAGRDCASACFLLLAAAPDRAAIRGARIGVHSARSYAGAETVGAMAATIHLARLAAGYGVPPAIIGRMVATGPADMAWLNADDLRAMRVTILEPAPARPAPARPAPPPAAVRRAPPSQSPPPAPFALPNVPIAPLFIEPLPGQAPPGVAYARGVEDGAAWGCWLLRQSPVGPRGGPELAACAEARRLWPGFLGLGDPAYRRGWEAGAASVLQSHWGG